MGNNCQQQEIEFGFDTLRNYHVQTKQTLVPQDLVKNQPQWKLKRPVLDINYENGETTIASDQIMQDIDEESIMPHEVNEETGKPIRHTRASPRTLGKTVDPVTKKEVFFTIILTGNIKFTSKMISKFI